jgi:hypothetical protein
MSPLEVAYWLRIPEARPPELAKGSILAPLWPVQGKIRPNACPAIRSANHLGVLFFTHHSLSFEGPRDFFLDIIALADQTFLTVPGVMGSYDSTVLFAKVDVGISVLDLPCPFLCTPTLDIEASSGFIVPSVLYPKGFTGPIFIPVASRSPCAIGIGYPLAQLIPLSEAQDLELKAENGPRSTVADDQFEGLLLSGWSDPANQKRHIRASKFLDLATTYEETELWNHIFMDPARSTVP